MIVSVEGPPLIMVPWLVMVPELVMVPPLIPRVIPLSTVSESPLFSVKEMFVTVHVLVLGSQLGLPEGSDKHDASSLISMIAAACAS